FVFKTQRELKAYLSGKECVGFVPTMGALHEGHIALINASKSQNSYTGCSIFVNPTQFNNQNDFDKYPITIANDILLLMEANCDFLFLPSVLEMYPEGIIKNKKYDLGYLDTVLEGAHRPGHFNGVCIIVNKLLEAVQPNTLYLGEKDYQQCMVIKHLIETLGMAINLVICPTLRDIDGLAKSSRNMRLGKEARSHATAIYQCLLYIKENKENHSFQKLQTECLTKLREAGFEPEYIALAKASNLQLLTEFDMESEMVVLIAATIDQVRLIDNMRL
nr:pantoate--beta-alanine ligase [Chitinophagaceae bacterium]